MSDHQLVARIKRSSKYWGQTGPNAWFDVRLVADNYYQLRGNNNNYRLSDVVMGARFDNGAIVDFSNGKVKGATIERSESNSQRPGDRTTDPASAPSPESILSDSP